MKVIFKFEKNGEHNVITLKDPTKKQVECLLESGYYIDDEVPEDEVDETILSNKYSALSQINDHL